MFYTNRFGEQLEANGQSVAELRAPAPRLQLVDMPKVETSTPAAVMFSPALLNERVHSLARNPGEWVSGDGRVIRNDAPVDVAALLARVNAGFTCKNAFN